MQQGLNYKSKTAEIKGNGMVAKMNSGHTGIAGVCFLGAKMGPFNMKIHKINMSLISKKYAVKIMSVKMCRIYANEKAAFIRFVQHINAGSRRVIFNTGKIPLF